MRIPIRIFAGVLALSAFALTGCSANDTQAVAMSEVSIREAREEADPQGAADAILANFQDRDYRPLEQDELEELIGISTEDITDFVVYYSDTDTGLCDLVFIRPDNGNRDQLREALYQFQNRRLQEVANFDIRGSKAIAEGAMVLDQGDYLVLLMLPDNQVALDLIDDYIPQ